MVMRGIVLVLDCVDAEELAPFWAGALGYHRVAAEAQYIVLGPEQSPATAGAPELILQQVDEPKAAKNRMHLDIHTDDLAAEVARIEALGATRVRNDPVEEAGMRWVVMADPQGNEFCVVVRIQERDEPAERPGTAGPAPG